MGVYPQATLAILLFAANTCVNVPVIVLHFRSPTMRDDMIAKVMASLCVSDLWLGSVLPAIGGAVAWIDPDAVSQWIVTLQGFIATTFTTCSHLHLALLAIFRCTVVVCPLTYFRVFSDRSMSAMLVSIHLLCVSVQLIALSSGVSYAFDRDIFLPYVLNARDFSLTWLGATFALTCVVILVCYVKIFLVVRRHVVRRSVHPMVVMVGVRCRSGGAAGGAGTGEVIIGEGRGGGGEGGSGAGSGGTRVEGGRDDERGGTSGHGAAGAAVTGIVSGTIWKGGRGGGGVGNEGGSGERSGRTQVEDGRVEEGERTRSVRKCQGTGGLENGESFSTLGLFATSVRSARNLFVMSIVYLLTYLPGVVTAAVNERFPLWYRFASKWLYLYASLGNGLLYVLLHKTVRRQLAKLVTSRRQVA